MNPLAYAQACARRYVLSRTQIKGRGHAPRVVIDKANAWMHLLPSEKIVDGRRPGNHFTAHHYTSADAWESFQRDLLAAGLNPTAQKYHLSSLTRPDGHPLPSDGRGAGGEGQNVILSRKYWCAAWAYWRLTNQIPTPDQRVAARVAGILKGRETKHRNACAAELAQIKELQRREREAQDRIHEIQS